MFHCLHTLFALCSLSCRSGFDGTARLWDSVTGDCLHVFSDHKMAIFALAFSPDARFFTTGSGDGWLHVYDVKVILRVDPFLRLGTHAKFYRPRRSATRGVSAMSDLGSSRLIGNSRGMPIGWRWHLSLTMWGFWMLPGYQTFNDIVFFWAFRIGYRTPGSALSVHIIGVVVYVLPLVSIASLSIIPSS